MKQRLSTSMCSALSGPSPAEDARDQIAVAVHQPLDRQAHLLLGEPAHFEQARLELFELVLEMPDALFGRRHQPNLPVT